MDEMSAWNNFVKTGKVTDYLIYSQIRNDNVNKPQEATSYANQYGWTDNNGTERGGE